MNIRKFLLILLSLTCSVWAQEPEVVIPKDYEPLKELAVLTSVLAEIEIGAEHHKKPTLFAIKRSAERALENSKQSHPQSPLVTNEIRNFVIMADSPAYFKSVITNNTVQQGEVFQKGAAILKKLYQVESPLGTFTVSTYRKIHDLLKSLDKHPVSEDFGILSKEILLELADIYSTSDEKDTKRMYEKAELLAEKIRELYVYFEDDDFVQSKEAFSIGMEIRGINEFYLFKVIYN